MSRHWNIHCCDCKATLGFDANRMLDLMRALVAHAPAIAALAPLQQERAAQMDLCFGAGLEGHAGEIDASWFAAHAGHCLAPIDEYGEIDGDRLQIGITRARLALGEQGWSA